VRIACAADALGSCRGTVALSTQVAKRLLSGAKPKPVRVGLGRASFVGVKPGRTRTVAVTLTRRARTLLGALGALRVTLTVKASDQRDVERTTTAKRTLRKPPPR
jgi:hypothetical protein